MKKCQAIPSDVVIVAIPESFPKILAGCGVRATANCESNIISSTIRSLQRDARGCVCRSEDCAVEIICAGSTISHSDLFKVSPDFVWGAGTTCPGQSHRCQSKIIVSATRRHSWPTRECSCRSPRSKDTLRRSQRMRSELTLPCSPGILKFISSSSSTFRSSNGITVLVT